MNVLFAMGDFYFHAVLGMEVFAEVLCTIDRAVLAARAAEGEHQIGEAALEVAFNMGFGQPIDTVEEGQDLTVFFEKTNDGGVQACQLLIGFVAAGIVCGTAIEDVASAIARSVLGNATTIGEGEDADE